MPKNPSFALLAYNSAWLKHHEPAAFLAALLNSQPMGFYAPAQLVQDARRHGVTVRPVDVMISAWESTLEPDGGHQPAVRLGLHMVSGFGEMAAYCLVNARTLRRFDSLPDLARRGQLNRAEMNQLAKAGALHSLAGHRHAASWDVAGLEKSPALLADVPVHETPALLSVPSEGENLLADYASLGLTLGRHPLALLRARLARMHLLSARELREYPSGRRARTAGIVIGRQRPGTASGVIFVTLEDETGHTNVVVWRDLGDRQRRELLESRLMQVEGILEREGEVVHLIAKKLTDCSHLLGRLSPSSRDFH